MSVVRNKSPRKAAVPKSWDILKLTCFSLNFSTDINMGGNWGDKGGGGGLTHQVPVYQPYTSN